MKVNDDKDGGKQSIQLTATLLELAALQISNEAQVPCRWWEGRNIAMTRGQKNPRFAWHESEGEWRRLRLIASFHSLCQDQLAVVSHYLPSLLVCHCRLLSASSLFSLVLFQKAVKWQIQGKSSWQRAAGISSDTLPLWNTSAAPMPADAKATNACGTHWQVSPSISTSKTISLTIF